MLGDLCIYIWMNSSSSSRKQNKRREKEEKEAHGHREKEEEKQKEKNFQAFNFDPKIIIFLHSYSIQDSLQSGIIILARKWLWWQGEFIGKGKNFMFLLCYEGLFVL